MPRQLPPTLPPTNIAPVSPATPGTLYRNAIEGPHLGALIDDKETGTLYRQSADGEFNCCCDPEPFDECVRSFDASACKDDSGTYYYDYTPLTLTVVYRYSGRVRWHWPAGPLGVITGDANLTGAKLTAKYVAQCYFDGTYRYPWWFSTQDDMTISSPGADIRFYSDDEPFGEWLIWDAPATLQCADAQPPYSVDYTSWVTQTGIQQPFVWSTGNQVWCKPFNPFKYPTGVWYKWNPSGIYSYTYDTHSPDGEYYIVGNMTAHPPVATVGASGASPRPPQDDPVWLTDRREKCAESCSEFCPIRPFLLRKGVRFECWLRNPLASCPLGNFAQAPVTYASTLAAR